MIVVELAAAQPKPPARFSFARQAFHCYASRPLMSADKKHSPTNEALHAAIALLEKAASNRALLAHLSDADHTRLMKIAGDLYCPDVDQRRRLVKAKVKQRKADVRTIFSGIGRAAHRRAARAFSTAEAGANSYPRVSTSRAQRPTCSMVTG